MALHFGGSKNSNGSSIKFVIMDRDTGKIIQMQHRKDGRKWFSYDNHTNDVHFKLISAPDFLSMGTDEQCRCLFSWRDYKINYRGLYTPPTCDFVLDLGYRKHTGHRATVGLGDPEWNSDDDPSGHPSKNYSWPLRVWNSTKRWYYNYETSHMYWYRDNDVHFLEQYNDFVRVNKTKDRSSHALKLTFVPINEIPGTSQLAPPGKYFVAWLGAKDNFNTNSQINTNDFERQNRACDPWKIMFTGDWCSKIDYGWKMRLPISTTQKARAPVAIYGATCIHPISIDGSYREWYSDDRNNNDYLVELTDGGVASVWDLLVFYDVSTIQKRKELLDLFYNEYFANFKQNEFTSGFQNFTKGIMKYIGGTTCTSPSATAITRIRDANDPNYAEKACWQIQNNVGNLRAWCAANNSNSGRPNAVTAQTIDGQGVDVLCGRQWANIEDASRVQGELPEVEYENLWNSMCTGGNKPSNEYCAGYNTLKTSLHFGENATNFPNVCGTNPNAAGCNETQGSIDALKEAMDIGEVSIMGGQDDKADSLRICMSGSGRAATYGYKYPLTAWCPTQIQICKVDSSVSGAIETDINIDMNCTQEFNPGDGDGGGGDGGGGDGGGGIGGDGGLELDQQESTETDADASPQTPDTPENATDGDDDGEDKSFLQKYWWLLLVIVLVLMMMMLGIVAVL